MIVVPFAKRLHSQVTITQSGLKLSREFSWMSGPSVVIILGNTWKRSLRSKVTLRVSALNRQVVSFMNDIMTSTTCHAGESRGVL